MPMLSSGVMSLKVINLAQRTHPGASASRPIDLPACTG